MKTKFLPSLRPIVGLVGILFFGACIPSIHPFYTEKDLVTDPRIFGTWQREGERWTFRAGHDGAMALEIEYLSNNRRGNFSAHLFKLEEHLFLDVAAQEIDMPACVDLVPASLIAGHLIIRVRAIAPKLELSFCDYKWLYEYLAENPSVLPHRLASKERAGPGSALTADTPALQAFVLAHLADGELFQPRDPNEAFDRVPIEAVASSFPPAEAVSTAGSSLCAIPKTSRSIP